MSKQKRLKPYVETLRYLEIEGVTLLLPSPLDLAVQRMRVDEVRAALERFEQERTPKEIAQMERLLPDLEGAAFERAAAKVDLWQDTRIIERRGLEARLFREERQIEQMEDVSLGYGAGDQHREDHFLMRPFSHQERLDVEDEEEVSTLDPKTSEVKVDEKKRNVRLFALCLIGECGADGKLLPDGEIGTPEEELEDVEMTVLMDRMLMRRRMAPTLAPYFRSRREVSGVRGAGPDGV